MRSLLAVALTAVASSPAAAAASGVLRGTVLRGPITPVCRVGTPCDAPAARTVLVFRRGSVTARVRTDDAGRYRISLGGGLWRVSLTGRGFGYAIQPQKVLVVAGRTRSVNFGIDTGIR